MSKCINKSHPEFKKLLLETDINPLTLAAKVGVWMDTNNTENFPSLKDLGLAKPKPSQILYQGGPSRGRASIKQARDLFFNEVYQKDLSENDIIRIDGKLRRMSDMIGDQPWRLRKSYQGNYYIAGYKNANVTAKEDT